MSWTGNKNRFLTADERTLLTSVFGDTLPPWERIFVTNGLGIGNRPWVDLRAEGVGGVFASLVGVWSYNVNLGDVAFGSTVHDRGLLVHELTHVWQSFNDTFARSFQVGSGVAQALGDAYAYTPGEDWGDYNPEQQAHLVEDWYLGGMIATDTDPRFPYIRDKVRLGLTG